MALRQPLTEVAFGVLQQDEQRVVVAVKGGNHSSRLPRPPHPLAHEAAYERHDVCRLGAIVTAFLAYRDKLRIPRDRKAEHHVGHVRRPRMMQLLKQTFEEWRSDEVGVYAAAVAYYAIFSLAPMLIIVIAVLTFFGRGDAQVAILGQVQSVAGQDAAQLVRSLIENRQAAGGNILATVVGLGLVLVGATGVMAQLQKALNIIWNVKLEPERSGLRHMLRVRAMSLLLIIGVGLLLVAARVGTAVLRSLAAAVREEVPQIGSLWTVLDPLILIVVSGLVFAVVFKYLPDVRSAWRTVVVGGLVTAVGFAMGNWLLSLYLSWGAVASVYGAAGALVAILLWVFVSSHILLLGAEFTKVYARRTGDRIVPDAHAVPRHR